ncbi:MAG: hypothetical protein MUF51_09790, partial [Vicinamibacteria bacterium]|nr:hypothetical protein [Vicinamibacteria bacterium]
MSSDVQLTSANKPSGRAIAALALGIVGLLANLGGCCCCFALILGLCSPVAAFLGFSERKAIQSGEAPAEGDMFAMIGMILGIVGTLAFIAMLIYQALSFFLWGGIRGLGALR